MDFLDIIFKRRSVRRFQNKQVDQDIVQKILQAAMAAPSACNFQPWEFIVIDDGEMLQKLRENLYFANYNAPLAIVVCANMNFVKGSKSKHWVEDCSASMENILLAATSLDLGSVWIGVHPEPSVEKRVHKLLDIPEHVNVLGIAYIGYPNEEKKSRTQYNEKVVYYQKYDPTRKHKTRDKNLKYKE